MSQRPQPLEEGLAPAIRKRRRESGWTQAELAVRAGVSLGMVRDLEQGRTARPNSGFLRDIAHALTDDPVAQADIAALARPLWGATETATPAGPAATSSPDSLRVQVLGPFAVVWAGAALALNGEKQRLLFAALAINANVWVHTRLLVDVLWPEDRPARAELLIRTYVARLSRLLASHELPTEVISLSRAGMHYRLQVSPESIDLLDFDRLVEDARQAVADGDPATGAERYSEALELWPDDPLPDMGLLRGGALLQDLRQRRTTTAIEFAEISCGLGRYARCLPMLERITYEEPLNEHAQACFILALAGLGQQASAMSRYREVCGNLWLQLAIAPSPVLEEAHQRILAGDLPPTTPAPAHLESPPESS